MSINQFTSSCDNVNKVELPDKNYQGQMYNLTLKAG